MEDLNALRFACSDVGSSLGADAHTMTATSALSSRDPDCIKHSGFNRVKSKRFVVGTLIEQIHAS
jgi:hypothetical protein